MVKIPFLRLPWEDYTPKVFFFLEQAILRWRGSFLVWRNAQDIGLDGLSAVGWNDYTKILRRASLCISKEGDHITW